MVRNTPSVPPFPRHHRSHPRAVVYAVALPRGPNLPFALPSTRCAPAGLFWRSSPWPLAAAPLTQHQVPGFSPPAPPAPPPAPPQPTPPAPPVLLPPPAPSAPPVPPPPARPAPPPPPPTTPPLPPMPSPAP